MANTFIAINDHSNLTKRSCLTREALRTGMLLCALPDAVLLAMLFQFHSLTPPLLLNLLMGWRISLLVIAVGLYALVKALCCNPSFTPEGVVMLLALGASSACSLLSWLVGPLFAAGVMIGVTQYTFVWFMPT